MLANFKLYLKSLYFAHIKASSTADLVFRQARVWSNKELLKFASLFEGRILNVSAGTDFDKENKNYQDYFFNAAEYKITNYFTDREAKENEFFLDLEKTLPNHLENTADVVFNHTTLEHIFNCRLAFSTLCQLSTDVVITIVPFLQRQHGMPHYSDYWRFTPQALEKMYEENGLHLRYCATNNDIHSSIYLFCIGYRSKKWDAFIPARKDYLNISHTQIAENDFLGSNILSNGLIHRFLYYLSELTKR